MDGAKLFPSRMLLKHFALLGRASSSSDLLRYLTEVVELRVLSFRRGDVRIIELCKCREAGDRME